MSIPIKARRRGREEAFRLLFQTDQGVRPYAEVATVERTVTDATAPAWSFALALAEGVLAQQDRLDGLLNDLAAGWTVNRMASADRAVLRLGAYEVLHRHDTPVSVCINEAVELAKRYGTEDSPRFVNGILGSLARSHPRGQLGSEHHGDEPPVEEADEPVTTTRRPPRRGARTAPSSPETEAALDPSEASEAPEAPEAPDAEPAGA